MEKISRAVAAGTLLMLSAATMGCSESPARPDVQFLASDVHFMVGSHHIVIPAVAMRGPGQVFYLARRKPEKNLKETLKSEASDPNDPMKMDKVGLLIRQYQYAGEHIASVGICPLLQRKWADALCRGQHRGLLARLPEKFDLLSRDKLDILASHWTVGGERVYDQVKDKALKTNVVEIGCDRKSRFCTAVVEVLPGLLAIWTVWSDEKAAITADQMAETQGAAIVQFVRRAIGPTEDLTLVSAD